MPNSGAFPAHAVAAFRHYCCTQFLTIYEVTDPQTLTFARTAWTHKFPMIAMHMKYSFLATLAHCISYIAPFQVGMDVCITLSKKPFHDAKVVARSGYFQLWMQTEIVIPYKDIYMYPFTGFPDQVEETNPSSCQLPAIVEVKLSALCRMCQYNYI